MSRINPSTQIEEIDKQLNQYSASLETIRDYLSRNEKLKSVFRELGYQSISGDLGDFTAQLNFSGFLTVSLLDLLVISKNMLRSQIWWEQLSQIWLGYLLIDAVLETYNKHSPELKMAAEKNSTLKSLFQTITTEIKTFKKIHDYPSKFKAVRNSTIGHIDAEFASFYDTVTTVRILPSYEAILNFTVILFKLREYSKENSFTLSLKLDDKTYSIIELEEYLKNRKTS